LPAEARRVSRTSGDLDGDRRQDQLVAYATVDQDESITGWRVRLLLGAGYGIDSPVRLPDPSFPGDVKAYGATDASGDGKDEGFIVVNGGVSVLFLGVVTVSECRIA
jgi:hypothetical protein